MKKTSLLLAALTLVSVGSSMFTSHAGTCGSTDRTASDPFGSCERTDGTVACGPAASGAVVPMVGTVIVDPNKGAQLCADDSQTTPISGRITVYKDGNNKVTVAADGGDKKNSGGAAGWDRVDLDPSGHGCVRRGSGGTYWATNGGTSLADSVNQCM